MRTLTASALSEIAKRYGTEPVTIVEISWEEGSSTFYADKDLPIAEGKILSVSPIESVLVSETIQSQQVSVSIDDTDGTIKSIIDTKDIHKRKAIVYQWYGDLTTTDQFNVFTGQISSPFSWGENDRQITFTILSEIETFPVGFSPEEGQLSFVSPDLVGKNWPLAFGNVVHVPAQKAKQVEEGRLLDMMVVVDPSIKYKIEETKILYNNEALYLQFWKLVQRGAHALHPPVEFLLAEVVKTIIALNALEAQVAFIQGKLDQNKALVQKNAWNIIARASIVIWQRDLEVVAQAANAFRDRMLFLREQCRLAAYAFKLKKRAAQEQIAAFNRMRELHAQYLGLVQELCDQQRFVKECVRVQNTKDIFTANVNTDVVVNGLRWRVQFNEDPEQMCYIAGPLERYSNLAVSGWEPDDAPCSEITELDGLDMFRLEQTPPPNLEKMYLLVKKKGTDDEDNCVDRHIIQVKKQEGQKIYFKLVEWDRGGGGGLPRGLSLERVIGTVVNTPFVPGPFGAPIPALGGDADPNIWLRPETARLLAILQSIGGPVTKEELATLTKLVFLAPTDTLGETFLAAPQAKDIYTITGPEVLDVLAAAKIPLESWFNDYCIPYEEVPEKLSWFARPGASIRQADDACEVYIANIRPSTIKAVHAYRTNPDGERFLAPIPSRYYIKNENADLGTYNVTALTFPQPLTEIPGERWEDDVYVTMDTEGGRNVVSTINWLISTYIPGKTVNAANFSAVSGKMTNYPVDFALFNRPDALAEIQQIAWESRLAVILKGDEFFLKYLSEEPTSDDTITELNIASGTVRVEYTRTEELTTEMRATYKRDYLPLEGREIDPRIILRHNVKKYGLHRNDVFFHTFAYPELVTKSATFWLIRRANTWKKITFETFHTKMRLETLDTVTLDLAEQLVSTNDIKTVVEQALYDPESNLISLTLHTGVRAGELEQYPFFWPANIDETTEFPTVLEISLGLAGGVGPGAGVTGVIGDCP